MIRYEVQFTVKVPVTAVISVRDKTEIDEKVEEIAYSINMPDGDIDYNRISFEIDDLRGA